MEKVTLPQALVFAFAIGACSWCFNSIQTSLGHTASADTQKDARDRELDDIKQRLLDLERDNRGCHRDR